MWDSLLRQGLREHTPTEKHALAVRNRRAYTLPRSRLVVLGLPMPPDLPHLGEDRVIGDSSPPTALKNLPIFYEGIHF